MITVRHGTESLALHQMEAIRSVLAAIEDTAMAELPEITLRAFYRYLRIYRSMVAGEDLGDTVRKEEAILVETMARQPLAAAAWRGFHPGDDRSMTAGKMCVHLASQWICWSELLATVPGGERGN